ncbi:MAG: Ditrans,polycis-undecaprenyl-diphosphate synthase ((2E,6E)-farnesyl-diphosphate specific) [Syntrophaceae bacterium PtaB.Bin095]|jgi:undecaprenyl diphosphate synthase|nr:MAG: Ditrans,polycis-undecaprenyl-diphosphate synthase ((2E,6E)-farnesyl-diphosphate specific) [Syntrophaceae bacterium PtaB.Bin095]
MTEIDPGNLPRHIAIIMDGNGRWAKQHAMGRIAGHKKGADAVRDTVRACREIGVRVLTLYAFSTENWLRPAREVKALMGLLEEYLRSEVQEMLENGIRLAAIGDMEALKEPIRGVLRETIARTSQNREMTLNLALSYGGRDEIVGAVKGIVEDFRKGVLSTPDITPDLFSRYLDTAGLPDPDLLIRTSGEYRISNFLLWQCAYTEFYFTDVLWPDFNRGELFRAIAEYQRRERRFGLTSDQVREGRPE